MLTEETTKMLLVDSEQISSLVNKMMPIHILPHIIHVCKMAYIAHRSEKPN